MKQIVFFVILGLGLLFAYLYFSRSKVISPTIVQNEEKNVQSLSVKEAYDILMKGAKDPNLILIDVRTSQEYTNERLINAINIDNSDPNLESMISALDKDKVYILYCRSGVRSEQFRQKIISAGILKAYSLQGGIEAWKKAQLPLATLSGE